MATKRPEHLGPPELYYNETEARKYTCNTHIIDIQVQMTERAVELLALPDDQVSYILDLGCGSGLSGEVVSESGHVWVGLDISEAMLDVARDREVDGDLVLSDLGVGVPFRPGAFDGAISISAVQWLCHSNAKSEHPPKRLFKLFSFLYGCLSRGSRAVFQLYPENDAQIELITNQAMKAGFSGGLVVDFPDSVKAKKFFLVLFVGGSQPLPKALTGGESTEASSSNRNHVGYNDRRESAKQIRGKPPKKSRDWIAKKKEQAKRRGKEVKRDSKYTGRKRPTAF